MRILVTGRAIPSQPDRCTGQQLAEGFIQAGHECVFYGNFYDKFHCWLGAEEATTQPFDLVVVTEMNDGAPGYEDLFKYLNLKDVPRLYWDFDVSYNMNNAWWRATRIEYDGYLVGNANFVVDNKGFAQTNKPTLHLPYACSPQFHRIKGGIKKQHIVGFVGSITPEREGLLDGVNCVEGVFGEDLIDATNSLYTMIHVNQEACKGLVPGRPWETAGCGVNLLMDRSSYEDFRPFITDELAGTAVVPFDTAEDIKKYWQSPHLGSLDALEEAGRALMEHVHTHHTYYNRAERIIEWTKEQGIL